MSIITPGTSAPGSITTTQLANDSVDATKIDFGTGANQVDTDVVTEGSTNLYYTDARVQSWFTGTGIGLLSTDYIAEGSSNLWYTNERVDDRVDALLQAGTNMTLTYDDSAGTLTVTGLTDAAIAGKVLGVNHSGNQTLQAGNNLTLQSGTDAGEFVYANSTDFYAGVSGAGWQFGSITSPSAQCVMSVYGATLVKIDEAVEITGNVDFSGLPTSDPSVAGRLWNDSGTVKISAG